MTDSNERARSVMDLQDVRKMEARDQNPRQYLREEYGVEAAKYREEDALRDAVALSTEEESDEEDGEDADRLLPETEALAETMRNAAEDGE